MSIFRLIALATVLTAGSAEAASFDYPEGGLRIDIPGDYVVQSEPGVAPPLLGMIYILTPDLTHPFIADFQSPVCIISHWADPTIEGLTQAEINALGPPKRLADAATPPGAMVEVSAEPFEHQGIAGLEVLYELPLSVIAQTHLVDFLLATPRGRFNFACGAAKDRLDEALPAYRRMLDGVIFSQ